MATTNFVDGVSLTVAAWFNDVDAFIYEVYNPATGALTLTGNATLGNAASDTHVITGTIRSTYSPTAFTEGNLGQGFYFKVSGAADVSGTGTQWCLTSDAQLSGATAASALVAFRSATSFSGSNTLASMRGVYQTVDHSGSGGVTELLGMEVVASLTGAGGVSSDFSFYRVGAITVSSSGDVTGTLRGFNVSANIGRAAASEVSGLFVANQTASTAGITSAARLQMTAGTGKWNIYADGTASNYLEGATGIGVAASTTTALAVVASTTAKSSLRIPHGTAPTAPVDGDVWSTTTTLNFRLNGVTKSVTLA